MSLRNKIYDLRVWLAGLIMPTAKEIEVEVNEQRANRGRIVTVKASVEYDPEKPQLKGGKVVRIMPKQLKKIKESQEYDPS